MYQRAITTEQFCDLYEDLQGAGWTDAGPMRSYTGTHPALGACTFVSDWRSGVVCLSELPIPGWMIGESVLGGRAHQQEERTCNSQLVT